MGEFAPTSKGDTLQALTATGTRVIRGPVRILIALVAALVAVGIVFAAWPGLDLAVTRYFYDNGGFWGGIEARDARDILRLAPFWLLGVLALLCLMRWITKWRPPAPTCRALLFLAASLILGSGVIVNYGLKDHSHRPRPVHVREFGGNQEFRPWYRFDGACHKNCSFASGEAASGAWMIAPALLAPPPLQGVAVAGALLYAVVTSVLRLAFGGHFLSDVLMGGLISAITVMAMWRFYYRRSP